MNQKEGEDENYEEYHNPEGFKNFLRYSKRTLSDLDKDFAYAMIELAGKPYSKNMSVVLDDFISCIQHAVEKLDELKETK